MILSLLKDRESSKRVLISMSVISAISSLLSLSRARARIVRDAIRSIETSVDRMEEHDVCKMRAVRAGRLPLCPLRAASNGYFRLFTRMRDTPCIFAFGVSPRHSERYRRFHGVSADEPRPTFRHSKRLKFRRLMHRGTPRRTAKQHLDSL